MIGIIVLVVIVIIFRVFKKIGGKLNVFNQFNYVRNCKKSGGF